MERINRSGEDVCPVRDQESLKKNVDKLAETEKSIGDPSCPPHVLRANNIARSIVRRASAGIVRGSSDKEIEEPEGTGSDCEGGRAAQEVVCSKKRTKEMGARDVMKRCMKMDEIFCHVESMSEAIVDLAKIMTAEKKEVDNSEINARVEEKVLKEKTEKNQLI